jgi:UDPglucose--hexose-1-phosphate uridylyltransferase
VSSLAADRRIDSHSGALTFVVGSRQDRPNLPDTGCPFCPGGLEAPEPYDVRWFVNRWPAMPGERCEVVLYTSQHEQTFWGLGEEGAARVVALWAERSAELGARPDIAYVLVFENRGPEVGATITHPHGQIYAFDFVPEVPRRELERGASLAPSAEQIVAAAEGWRAWVPEAPTFPYALLLAPDDAIPDLPSLSAPGRRALARLLIDVLERLDRMFAAPAPYMLWIHQRPFDGGDWPHARLHVEIVTPWRAAGVVRHVAAGELGSGVYWNPVAPEDAARALREAGR